MLCITVLISFNLVFKKHFNTKGSAVYLAALDIKKAFDSVKC